MGVFVNTLKARFSMTAKNIAVGVVIGGAVAATLGRSVADAKGKIGSIAKEANKTRMFQRAIGDAVKLQTEIGKVAKAGGNIDALSRKFDAKTASLKRAGIAVHDLNKEYSRLGATVRGLDLRQRGQMRIGQAAEMGRTAFGQAAAGTAATAIPAAIAAEYQAIIRDIAIKAGIAGTAKEGDMSRGILAATKGPDGKQFIGRNELAQAVNVMVGKNMDVGRAVKYAPLAAKFGVGQGSSVEEAADMITALEQNAKIMDAGSMAKALESIAYLGKEGSFESRDMAKWFPSLLAEMQKNGIYGQESVSELGAMLQVQMKTAGSSDEAANNLKNWFSKIGSGETEKNYDKAGIDYHGQMNKAIGKGYSPLEASLQLAKLYIEKTDPAKAKEMVKAAAELNKEQDPQKVKRMQKAFEETMKTGDLFADMQVKAALTAYMQNADLYRKLKQESAQATGELDKDLAARRATSDQIWKENAMAWNEAARSIGDATREITDFSGKALTGLGNAVRYISDTAPGAAEGMLALGGAIVAIKGTLATLGLLKGGNDLLRARLPISSAPAATGAALPGAAEAGAGAGGAGIGAAIRSMGFKTVASRLGLLGLSGAGGYSIGSAWNWGAGKLIEHTIGSAGLGGLIYDKTHPDTQKMTYQGKPPAPQVKQDLKFNPNVNLTIKGDLIDTGQLVQRILPQLKSEFMPLLNSQFEQFTAKQKQLALHDEPHL